MSVKNEPKIAQLIEQHTKQKNLKKSKNKFSPYDYYNENYLFEFKERKGQWTTTFLEQQKLEQLRKKSKRLKRQWCYCVSAWNGIFIFTEASIKDLPVVVRSMNATTEFGAQYKVDKEIIDIPFVNAVKCISAV